jgi:uroporphyrinogen decarboxylase
MSQTPRELVIRCLSFQTPERMPRDLWLLPWAEHHFPAAVAEIQKRFPNDIITAEYAYPLLPCVSGDPYRVGTYVDEWGSVFTNIQDGVIGEVRTPLLPDISQWSSLQPPYAQLPQGLDRQKAVEAINRFHDQTDCFVLANACPRPWERYQFIRGSENSYIDIMMPDSGTLDLLRAIHEFYMRELEFWVKTDVDGIKFMDDWGAQQQLLIPPALWRAYFKPLYKEYCDIAKAHGKWAFMHSDGYIQEIYTDLIEVGVDALNSQLFCMDMGYLQRQAKGRITFWGEIDRQHVLPSPDPEVGRRAVQRVASHLYDRAGGIIAQFEFGAGAQPETALAVFKEWEAIQQL